MALNQTFKISRHVDANNGRWKTVARLVIKLFPTRMTRTLKFSSGFHSVNPERDCLDETLATDVMIFTGLYVRVPLS